jgi:hypothetical protein
VVTDIDIYKQLDALDFARQSRKIWVPMSVDRNSYIFLWKLVIFASLFKKDILDIFSRPISLLYRLYDIIWLGVLFSLCLSWLMIVLNPLFQFIPSLVGMYYWMICFGALGAIIFILQYFRTKTILNLIVIYSLTILMYFFARYIITTNFAL